MSKRLDDEESKNCRVFVGGLTPDCDQDALKEKFSKHGEVDGVLVLKNYAFVQFLKEDDAMNAISKENGTEFNGRKIDVKTAVKKTRTPNLPPGFSERESVQAGHGGGNSSNGGNHENRDRDRDRDRDFEPRNKRFRDNDGWEPQEKYGGRGGGGGGGGDWGRGGRGGGRGGGGQRWERGGRGGGGGGGRWREGGGGGGGGGGRWPQPLMGNDYQGNNYQDDFSYGSHGGGGPMMNMQGGGHGPRGGPGQMGLGSSMNFNDNGGPGSSFGGSQGPFNQNTNDVEIVCVNKGQRNYSEMIESRLKTFGLNVDVLFPNPEIPLAKILGNIASRGVMYAIVVTALNQENRSLTLNILQGQQQEHRNMPIDDAMNLIAKNFENLIERRGKNNSGGGARVGNDQGGSGSGTGGGAGGSGNSLPQDINTIIGFMKDNRPLSVMEYDKMIRFLANKREQMLKLEYGEDGIPPNLKEPPIGPPIDPAIKSKQDKMQAKIMEIMNKRKESLTAASVAQKAARATNSSSSINPSLQQAIDSLIKTGPNLLNSLGTAPPPPPPPPEDRSASNVGDPLTGYFASLYGGQAGAAPPHAMAGYSTYSGQGSY